MAACLIGVATEHRAQTGTGAVQSPEQRDVRVAGGLLFLLLREHDWVHRRVETFSFVDADTARRQMSVDFTLPLGSSRLVDDLYRFIPPAVPLTMLSKQPLSRFSVWDESGIRLPVLSTPQNGRLAGTMLVGIARTIARRLGSSLPDEVGVALTRVAMLPPRPASLLFRCLDLNPWQQADLLGPSWAVDQRVLSALDPLSSHVELLQEILRSGPLRVLASELSQQFILFAQLPDVTDGQRRRILKFAYDEPLSLPQPTPPDWKIASTGPLRNVLLESMGWSPRTFSFSAVAAGHAASHHVEIEAPPEMEIVTATLRAPGLEGRVHSDRAGGGADVVHLQVQDVPRESRGTATVSLRAKRAGLLRTAPVLGWLTAAALLFAKSHARQIDRGAGTALLLALPTLVAAFIARPGEHALATQALIGVRLCVLGVGLCSAAVALSLATGISGHHELRDVIQVASDVACGLSAALTASWLLPRAL